MQHLNRTMQVGTWTTVWHTDALDSDGSLISGLTHVPRLPGLAGGDGHAGYLIYAANQTLNLYECSASGGRGEASLQVPHQAAPALFIKRACRGNQIDPVSLLPPRKGFQRHLEGAAFHLHCATLLLPGVISR